MVKKGHSGTDIEAQVEFGLDTVPINRRVSAPLRDLLFIHQTLGELVRFFISLFTCKNWKMLNGFRQQGQRWASYFVGKLLHANTWYDAGRY